MKKIYKTPSILCFDAESEYGYCQEIPIASSDQNATSGDTGTGSNGQSSTGLVKSITMDRTDDDW